MKRLAILFIVLLAGCGDINHPGDETAGIAECKEHSGLYYWSTSAIWRRPQDTPMPWQLTITCRDKTQITIVRRYGQ